MGESATARPPAGGFRPRRRDGSCWHYYHRRGHELTHDECGRHPPVESVPEIFIGDVQKSCIRGPADVVDDRNIDAAEASSWVAAAATIAGILDRLQRSAGASSSAPSIGLGPATTMPPTVSGGGARAAETAGRDGRYRAPAVTTSPKFLCCLGFDRAGTRPSQFIAADWLQAGDGRGTYPAFGAARPGSERLGSEPPAQ